MTPANQDGYNAHAAVYNEIDPFAAAWLGNLAAAGHVAAGRVDARSILELSAADVTGPGQRHFFAGIGIWSYALRLAGWPDDAAVWTGSCPCQPFSTAGARKGSADARHLWPAWAKLIRKCRPPVVFGEQVAGPDGRRWLDAVCADLEGAGYAVGAANLSAGGVGAPHARQRLYFVAYAGRERLRGLRVQLQQGRSQQAVLEAARRGEARAVADADRGESGSERGAIAVDATRAEPLRVGDARIVGDTTSARRQGPDEQPARSVSADARKLGHAGGDRDRQHAGELHRDEAQHDVRRPDGDHASVVASAARGAGATRGHWADADWIWCRDGRYRPTQPGLFPLAHGAPARMGRLRGYGNGIVAQVAATFISSVMDVLIG